MLEMLETDSSPAKDALMLTRLIFSLSVFLLATHTAHADNWPHWRGDTGNGVSLTANPPVSWSPTENVKWKTPIPGQGSGSPIVWEDRVFVTASTPTTPGSRKLQFKLFCVDRENGQIVWERTATEAIPHEGTHSTNGYASASPCTDGKHVYAHFGSRGLFCYTLEGEKVWERTDLGQMRCRGTFGEGSSPTLAGEMIIVPWDHEGPSYIAALDKTTGETVWKTARDEPTCWATPLVVTYDGKKQIIMNGQNCARAYELKTGEELWRCAGQTQRPVACPVQIDDVVAVGSGFRGSFMAGFELGGRGNIEGTDNVLWTIERDTPDIASLLLSENRLYFTKGKTGILSCVNAKTGEYFFGPSRLPGIGKLYASPIAAGGHVYITDRDGTVTVIKDAEELEVVGTNTLNEPIDATPAPVDNELFIRGARNLYCISE